MKTSRWLPIAVAVAGFGVLALFNIGYGGGPLPDLWAYRSATWGDGLLLPLALWASLDIVSRAPRAPSQKVLLSGAAVGGIGSISVLATWLMDPEPSLNWTLTAPHRLSPPGYWHAGFMIAAGALFGAAAFAAIVSLRSAHARGEERALALPTIIWLGSGYAYVMLVLLDSIGAVASAGGVASIVAVATIVAATVLLLRSAVGSREATLLVSAATLLALDILLFVLAGSISGMAVLASLAIASLGAAVALCLDRPSSSIRRVVTAGIVVTAPLASIAFVSLDRWPLAAYLNLTSMIAVLLINRRFSERLVYPVGWASLVVVTTLLAWSSVHADADAVFQWVALVVSIFTFNRAFRLIKFDFSEVMELESKAGTDDASRRELSKATAPNYWRITMIALSMALSLASWTAMNLEVWWAEAGIASPSGATAEPPIDAVSIGVLVVAGLVLGLVAVNIRRPLNEVEAPRVTIIPALATLLALVAIGVSSIAGLRGGSSLAWLGSGALWFTAIAVLISLFGVNAVLSSSSLLQLRRPSSLGIAGAASAGLAVAVLLLEGGRSSSQVIASGGGVAQSWSVFFLHAAVAGLAVIAISGSLFVSQGAASHTLRGVGAGIYQDATMCLIGAITVAWPILAALTPTASPSSGFGHQVADTMRLAGPTLYVAGLVFDWLLKNNDSHVGREWSRLVGPDLPHWAEEGASQFTRFSSIRSRIIGRAGPAGDGWDERYVRLLARHTALQNCIGYGIAYLTVFGVLTLRGFEQVPAILRGRSL